jgi:hypothetical protein
VVISYRYWRDVLGGDDVLGTVMEIDFQSMIGLAGGAARAGQAQQAPTTDAEDIEYQIVGVMAAEMTGATALQPAVWLPFEPVIEMMIPAANVPEQMRAQLRAALTRQAMQTFARRSVGASTEAVIEEIQARYADAPDELSLQPGFRLDAVTGIVTDLNAHRSTLRQLRLFLGASVLIALVAAANVSLFLLARAPGRRRELGIRMAVGAPLGRLARQLASEVAALLSA